MPESIFSLVWLLPLAPFLSFALIILFTNRNTRLSAGLAIGGIAFSWILGWIVVLAALNAEGLAEDPARIFRDWLPMGSTWQAMGFAVDPLTAAMLFMVPFVCFLIFVYSVGYMGLGKPGGTHGERGLPAEPGLADPLVSRFFAYIALFACGMIGLVLSDNLILFLVFWELMGLCSYLLIGFWFARRYADPAKITPKQAGLKAFLTTRIGDTLMLLGILLLFAQTGSLTFTEVFEPSVLASLASSTVSLPLLGISVPWATIIAILIFWGAIGKSAQFPLHVWLPDAMEGPTPVSALIHAATMVSAGVYLGIRTFPLMTAVDGGATLLFISFIGAFTALLAASIAVAQNDIKKVLAYSTISQLGYMFAALGIGAYVAAVFHLLTHAFFKALLFLGSGSVIHGMELGHHEAAQDEDQVAHGAHDSPAFDPQDMRNMGGLFRRMPRTAWTFIIGGLALSGFPFVTAGFWSKDEIISEAYAGHHWLVFVALLAGALLTAFYATRQIVMTFFGKPRTAAAQHANEHDSVFTWMTVPLMVLAVFAVAAGWGGIPTTFPGIGALLGNPFHHFVGTMAETIGLHAAELAFDPAPILASIVAAIGGILLGLLVYRAYAAAGVAERRDPLRKGLGPVYVWLESKLYFDELYDRVFVRTAVRLSNWLFRFDDVLVIDPIVDGIGRLWHWISEGSRWVDTRLVDAAVNGVGDVTTRLGAQARRIQTGRVQSYLLVALVSVSVLLAVFLFLPK